MTAKILLSDFFSLHIPAVCRDLLINMYAQKNNSYSKIFFKKSVDKTKKMCYYYEVVGRDNTMTDKLV